MAGGGLTCCDEDIPSEDLLDDPTLAECCIRDIKQSRYAERIRSELAAVDRSVLRTKLRESVILQKGIPGESIEDEEEDGEDDELESLRNARMRELQREQALSQESTRLGRGQLVDVPSTSLLGTVQKSDGFVVVHLAIEGFEPGAQLDEQLTSVAAQHNNVRFIRCYAPRGSTLRRELNLDSSPALLVFRDGALMGRSPITAFGGLEELIEEQVAAYLKRFGVLSSKAQHGRNAGSSDDEENELERERTTPCEICGRDYLHTHIKAVYKAHDLDEDSDVE